MFTIFHLLDSEKVDKQVSDKILEFLTLYKNTENGKWLNKLNLDEIEFYYCNHLDYVNLGSYEPLIANNKIFIKPIAKNLFTRKLL
jgi:hypothetical protein